MVNSVKLLVLHSELGVLRGGGENFTRNLFTAMTKRGHEVSAAFAAGVSGKYPVPLPEGITPIPVRGWWSRKPGQAAFSFVARFMPKESSAGRAWQRVMGSMEWRGARWQKMALKVFKLPGGEGGLRKPYLMPSDAEVERFTTGLLALGLTEIDELARAAGLR